MVCGKKLIAVVAGLVLGMSSSLAQVEVQLTVKEIMNAMITPSTNTIWGAYQLASEAQWQEIENAALTVIAAGNLLALGGAGPGESAAAVETDWRQHNDQMIEAAKEVLAASII